MELAHIPSIDWNLGIKLAGNQRQLAEDMLNLLLKDLDEVTHRISEQYQSQDYKKMQQEVHKLRGAASYCGVPRLKTILEQLETSLKTHIMDNLPSLLSLLDTEVSLLLQHRSSFSN